jgi:hypothetical protein
MPQPNSSPHPLYISPPTLLLLISQLYPSSTFLLYVPPLNASFTFPLYNPPLHTNTKVSLYIPLLNLHPNPPRACPLYLTPLRISSTTYITSFLFNIPSLHVAYILLFCILLYIHPKHPISTSLLYPFSVFLIYLPI